MPVLCSWNDRVVPSYDVYLSEIDASRSHCVYVCGTTSYKTGCKHCLAPATIVRDAKSSVPVAALCVVLHCLRSKSLTVGQGTALHSSVLQGLQSWTSATSLCATTNTTVSQTASLPSARPALLFWPLELKAFKNSEETNAKRLILPEEGLELRFLSGG